MDTNSKIGIFWAKDALYVALTTGTQLQEVFNIPLSREAKISIERGAYSSGSADLITTIESAFRENNLGTASVNLSLPTKDIIFRSFVIPWMQASEIRGVIEFEVNKYIPFSLAELSYSYHHSTITEEGTKRIRIVFAAIKKQTLDNYTSILEQTGLSVDFVEPAPISLMRALSLRQFIPKDKTIALIERGEALGKIVIIDKEIPQFVREFQLKIPTATGQDETDPKAIFTRIVNEIRISLDYFGRQNTQLDVKEILFLTSSQNSEETTKKIEADIGIPVRGISNIEILQKPIDDTRYLMAYGAALSDAVANTVKFELSGKKPAQSKTPFFTLKKDVNIKSTVATIFICLLAVTGMVLYGQFSQTQPNEERSRIEKKLGSYRDSSKAKLEETRSSLKGKLNYLKNLSYKSNMSSLLTTIPDLLPKGTWIDNLELNYSDPFNKPKTQTTKGKKQKDSAALELEESKLTINLTGYAYIEDANAQFQLVNDFFSNLKNNKTFSSAFTNIDLVTVKADTLDDYRVTYFEIKFE